MEELENNNNLEQQQEPENSTEWNEYENDWQHEAPNKRPTMLLVLCILTFIGSGCNVLSHLCMPVVKKSLPMLESYYEQMGMGDIYSKNASVFEGIAAIDNWKFFITALTYILAIVGAAMMLKMKKLGFHLYVIAQLLTFCCLNFLIAGPFKMSVGSITWTILFILLYFIQLKSLLIQPKENQ